MKWFVYIGKYIVRMCYLGQLCQTILYISAYHFFVLRIVYAYFWHFITDKVLMPMCHKVYFETFHLETLHYIIALWTFTVTYP